jgi:hypothetical protein
MAAMLDLLSVIALCAAGAYLVVLGVAAVAFPAKASRFLLAFAGSARAHYLELAIRLAVGGALVLRAPSMPFSGAWLAIGWVLIVSTAILLLLPWRWHRAFAERTVPPVLRFMVPLGIASAVVGIVLTAAAVSSAA